MSLFGSRGTEQTTTEELLAEARDDYARHNSPDTRAAAREASGQTRTTGNANGGSRWGR
ncbi:hypothetical protein [Actinacidiphila sp. ITFR-21]|uniref:hypothetical protein n=1 Tax=Actinacidiphila sp. ITFR-21 TaxID=3075199 RepID=UPI002889DC1C|nr:hypothetical protein [Streptomyces sp. ITFR-21]WNI15728.1 hypothetical protein RLT57_09455 [Streptomyces sp. ITFR-21]